MYKRAKLTKTSIKVNESYQGETIEHKVDRIVNNKEPIKDGAPLVYTERKDGVQPVYDIRTDRFEIAAEAMDKVAETHRGKREAKIKNIDNGEETKTIEDKKQTTETGLNEGKSEQK